MAENLNYDVPNNTTDVCHSNNSSNCATYGRLYNWSTAMGIDASYNDSYWSGSDVKHQGICPDDWYLPSDADWDALMTAVSGSSTAGTKLKARTGWYSNSGTDDYGFSALPGGGGNSDGNFVGAGGYGYWWSAAELNSDYAYGRYMYYDYEYANWYYYDKDYLFSVRCLQD